MILCDLKDALYLTDQYVKLRNLWAKNLLTDDVNEKETLEWLHEKSVVILVACEEDEVVGASILYLEKEGEIAIFVKRKRSGVGTTLLKEIQAQAKNKNIKKLWAWISDTNIASKKLFEKNKFNADKPCSRVFSGTIYNGMVYEMEII